MANPYPTTNPAAIDYIFNKANGVKKPAMPKPTPTPQGAVFQNYAPAPAPMVGAKPPIVLPAFEARRAPMQTAPVTNLNQSNVPSSFAGAKGAYELDLPKGVSSTALGAGNIKNASGMTPAKEGWLSPLASGAVNSVKNLFASEKPAVAAPKPAAIAPTPPVAPIAPVAAPVARKPLPTSSAAPIANPTSSAVPAPSFADRASGTGYITMGDKTLTLGGNVPAMGEVNPQAVTRPPLYNERYEEGAKRDYETAKEEINAPAKNAINRLDDYKRQFESYKPGHGFGALVAAQDALGGATSFNSQAANAEMEQSRTRGALAQNYATVAERSREAGMKMPDEYQKEMMPTAVTHRANIEGETKNRAALTQPTIEHMKAQTAGIPDFKEREQNRLDINSANIQAKHEDTAMKMAHEARLADSSRSVGEYYQEYLEALERVAAGEELKETQPAIPKKKNWYGGTKQEAVPAKREWQPKKGALQKGGLSQYTPEEIAEYRKMRGL